MAPLAHNLKQLRKQKGLTQSQLAKKIGISMAAIRSYENGLREPNSKAMAALENYFHVTGAYLRGESTEESTYIWEDSEIMDSVRDTMPTLINKLLASFNEGTSLEQKMLFDILVELYHISRIQKDDPAFRSAAFQLMQENFVQTTRFIDFCKQLPASSEIENSRVEKFKTSCVADIEEALSEFQDSLNTNIKRAKSDT